MEHLFSVDGPTLSALFLMALATYFTRISGIVLVERLSFGGRRKAAMEAVAPGVLTAMIAPVIVEGIPEAAAALVTLALARVGGGMVVSVAGGVATAALLRMVF